MIGYNEMSGRKEIAQKYSLFKITPCRECKLMPFNSETGLKIKKGSSDLPSQVYAS